MRLQTILLFLCLGSSMSAQTTPLNRWGITAGWTEGAIGDQHISPLLYQSDVLNIGGLFQHRGSTFIEASLIFGIGTSQAQNLRYRKGTFVETPNLYGETDSYDYTVNPFFSSINGQLNLKAYWKLNENNQLGIKSGLRYWLAGMAGDTWQYAQFDLAPAYQYTRAIGTGEVQAGIELPLLAFVVRPNYGVDPSLSDETNYFKGFVRTGSSWASLDRFVNPKIHAGYLYHLKNGKDIGAYYKIQWTSFPEPRPVRILEHGLDLVYFF